MRRIIVVVAGILLTFTFTAVATAADYFVATNGTAAGPGTAAKPYDIVTALKGALARPGDTYWIHGGNYKIGYLTSSVHGAPGSPVTLRGVAGERVRLDGQFNFFSDVGYLIVRDLELYNSDTKRVSTQTGMGLFPTDVNRITGLSCFSPNCFFINLVVHDHTRNGIYVSEIATNGLVYGCLVYNNGFVSPDNSEGHSFYCQGQARQELSDNISLNGSGNGFQVYASASGHHLYGMILDGNVQYGAGSLSTARTGRDWIIGVDAPSVYADAITFKNNMGYYHAYTYTATTAQFGREGVNGSILMANNYLPLAVLLNNWQGAVITSNMIAASSYDYIVNVKENLTSISSGQWRNNEYHRPSSGLDFYKGSSKYTSLSAWKSATGFDSSSTYAVGPMTGTKVFVRTNRYEAGRANIIVYNWDKLDTVEVDVSSFLPTGTAYEVRNVQDFYAAPVLAGTFDGQPLPLPMNGLTVASPTGLPRTPPPTGPEFNVFILLPSSTSAKPRPPSNLKVVAINSQ